ncbi:MAG: hypothetical protein V1744_02520 [Candidatus Altiarchaeota archaeon]
MEQKSFTKENTKSLLFTILVLALGTAALYQQGYFNSKTALNPMIFGDMQIKILFEDNTPEFIAYAPAEKLSTVPTLMGESVPETDSMVLGYDEAKEMSQENNITASEAMWGFNVDEGFLGKETRVSGMLEKTDTLMDMMHILSKEKFNSIPPGEKIHVKFTEDKMPKFFYYIKPDSTNWPKKTFFAAGSMLDYEELKNERTVIDLNIVGLDLHIRQNKTYLPLVLGAQEATMMRREGIFAKVGDKIDNFFGRDVVVAGILEPTDTPLDMFHYMPAE